MKKILLGALALSMVLYGNEASDNTKDTQLETIEKPEKKESDVKKPKKENIQNLMDKAKRELQKKNKQAKVYMQSVGVDVGPDDSQYYDFLTSAYNQAVLEIKAQMVLKKSGSLLAKESFKLYNKTIPEERLQAELKKKVDNQLREAEQAADITGVFSIIGGIIGGMISKDVPAKEKEKLVEEATESLFNKAMMEEISKEAFDEISGLIPYETFIVVNENNQVEIGVLAYTTPKSIQLARDLRNNRQSKKTTNTSQCRSAEDIAGELEDEELLSHFGIKYFYNENCRPALLAYGMDSFEKQENMESDLRSISIERARGIADKFISNFLNSNVAAVITDKKTAQKSKKAIMKAVKDGANTTYSPSKEQSTDMIKEMAKEFTSSSSMRIEGLEDARTWSVDKDDYEVAGVIRYYSMDSILSTREEFNPKEEEEPKKATKKTSNPGVKRSSNLDVSDF